MTTSAEILESMQFTSLFGSKVNRDDRPDRDDANNEQVKIITFNFAGTTAPADFLSADRTGWTEFTDAEKAIVAKAMADMETFLNVQFKAYDPDGDEGTEPDLNLGKVDLAGGTDIAFGYEATVADVSVDHDNDDATDPITESQITGHDAYALFDNTMDFEASYARVLQVLGHAMGLKNSFIGPLVPDGTDSQKYTVMSNQVDPDTSELADTYQAFDILAMQDLWGAKVAGNDGDTSYTGNAADSVEIVMDASGTDIFDASAQTGDVVIDLNAGAISTFDDTHELAISFGSVIENATGGTGNDSLAGNAVDNVLIGGAGDDSLFGGDGKDTLKGGRGADQVYGGDRDDDLRGFKGNDVIYGDAGKDELRGGAGSDQLFGGERSDTLLGGLGDDTLDGGAKKDILTGGAGADTFVFADDSGKDTITDFENDIDTISFSRSDITTAEAALDHAENVGADVVFTFDDGSKITVENTTIAAITDDISII